MTRKMPTCSSTITMLGLSLHTSVMAAAAAAVAQSLTKMSKIRSLPDVDRRRLLLRLTLYQLLLEGS